MLDHSGGPFLEALWPCLSAFDVIRVRATANEFNDAKKYGPHAELYFFLLRDNRCETDPVEPGHVSIVCPVFTFSFVQPEGLFLPAGNDPLSQAALGGFPWLRASGPNGTEAGPAYFHAPENCGHHLLGLTLSSLMVSSSTEGHQSDSIGDSQRPGELSLGVLLSVTPVDTEEVAIKRPPVILPPVQQTPPPRTDDD